MPKIKSFGVTKSARVTVLIDNMADHIMGSTETVKRFTEKPLLAAHGFSALIDLSPSEPTILWDAGVSGLALVENMQRMEIDPKTIDKIALSHGHSDHTAGVTAALKAIDAVPQPRKWEPDATMEQIRSHTEASGVPVIVHPAVFRERWKIGKDGTKRGPFFPPPRGEWEAAGAEIILSEGPCQLGQGCWTTGLVPRLSFEESGRSATSAYRQGDTFLYDDIEDDQAVVMNIKGKGLVIVAGCAHSGIVNTVNYAREISGVDRVWAIVGGLHLARAEEWEIQRTIDEVQKFEPVMVVPSHCTGFRAMCQFAARMPDQFVLGLVGTTYLF